MDKLQLNASSGLVTGGGSGIDTACALLLAKRDPAVMVCDINAVCPGAIETPLVRKAMLAHSEISDQASAMIPIGRLGKPKEVAEVVAGLCSDATSRVVEHMLAFDGAWYAS